MAMATCPACGIPQEIPAAVSAFRCRHCQRDAWIIQCRRCHGVAPFFGSATGSGSLEFRCGTCRSRTVVPKPVLRARLADARRIGRAVAAASRDAAAQAREAKLHHAEARQAGVERMNRELHSMLLALRTILSSSISSEAMFTFACLKTEPSLPVLAEPPPLAEGPQVQAYMPPPLTGISSLLPGAKRKHETLVQLGQAAYQQTLEAHEMEVALRQAALNAAKVEFANKIAAVMEAAAHQHQDVDDLEAQFQEGDPAAVSEYMGAALAAMTLPYDPPAEPRVAFSPASRQLVIELELPTIEVIPTVREYRYVKTRDEISEVPMPVSERSHLYTSVVAQVTLSAISEAFRADHAGVVATIVLNGNVQTIDKRTGQQIHPCLVTVRTTRDHLGIVNLRQVDPIECLKGLNASVSRNPSELTPVRPLLTFDMVDPRFVKETDVLSGLDARPNLMELTPMEFESLITNLFEKMGLETRLTQPSRDGGVDCVAYDARPILGGKVVVQAKRYKDTVGVSAVRDLFGTVQNEGATKGILVTTSGYGQASHDFANGKPLELIDGANLLYLLHEHAGTDAKIEAPDDWVDPPPPR